MVEQILMAASGVITLSSCYVAWHYAKQAQTAAELLAFARSDLNELEEDFDKEVADNIYKAGEIDRLSDLVAKYQRNKPEREANGKFASKKKRVTAELAAYVASKAA
jgi:hypothetical protein